MLLTRIQLICVGGLLFAQTALGADPVVEDNPAQRAVELQQPPSTGQWTLGLGMAYTPAYEGSKEYEFRPLPLVSYRRGAFSAGIGGLSYNLSSSRTFEFGPRLSLRNGRDESDADRLRGLGDIDIGVAVGAFARWRIGGGLSLQGDVSTGLGDAEGTEIVVGLNQAIRLGATDALLLGASVNWADDKYTETFYGITAAQSAASGLPAYSAAAGIRSYGVSASWIHRFTPNWFSTVGVQVKYLAGDAADSPITEKKEVIRGSAAIGYRF